MINGQDMPIVAVNENGFYGFIPKMLNRHGIITGATGTGKTVTLQTLAETFSALGISVFAADMKGDLSGIAAPGGSANSVKKRVVKYRLEENGFAYSGCPTCFWDVFGEEGHPLRTTISEIGPLLLERLLDLNDTQGAVLNAVFKIADDHNLLLIDLKDLKKMVQFVGDNRKQFTTEYGNISPATIGAIQRSILRLETEGGDFFFGEPDLDIYDLFRRERGKGVVNILAADKLSRSPRIYTTMLLWMLSKLYEELPEVGDLPVPKMVFFFDEAHMLFNDMSKSLLEKVEQIVRLIRSKGVGIFFCTQNPIDIPNNILGQLGNRVQHALRSYTANDRKAIQAAARSFRDNPEFDTETAISELEVGEALISMLDEKGAPEIIQRVYILPPQSQIGPLTPEERKGIINKSKVFGVYERAIDRESAYEILTAKTEEQDRIKAEEEAQKAAEKERKEQLKREREEARLRKQSGGGLIDDFINQIGKSTKRKITNEISKSITRTIFGTFFGKKKR